MNNKSPIIAAALSAFVALDIVCMPPTPTKTNPLLHAPKTITPTEMITLTNEAESSSSNFTMGMPWGFDYFKYENGKVTWGVEYYEDTLPEGLTESEKAQFTARECGEGDAATRCFMFRYGDSEPTFALNMHGRCGQKLFKAVATKKQDGYSFALDRGVKDDALAGAYQKNTPEQLAQMVSMKKIIFYTGAGISVAAGVAAGPQLAKTTGIRGDGSLESLRNRMQNAEAILNCFKQFFAAAFTAQPTKAHTALAQLALTNKCQVLTENFDLLHERSGIHPYKFLAKGIARFDADFGTESLRDIDAIICIGMQNDNRGLLAKYKELNPAGTIVAFDLKRPQFIVDNDDVLVEGDLQQTFPAFVTQLLSPQRKSGTNPQAPL